MSDVQHQRHSFNFVKLLNNQTAALDEIFGDQDGSFTKYQAAHTIFHSLNQSIVDVKFGDDKNRILKLQRAVEDRLTHLNDQGLGYMYDTVIATY